MLNKILLFTIKILEPWLFHIGYYYFNVCISTIFASYHADGHPPVIYQ